MNRLLQLLGVPLVILTLASCSRGDSALGHAFKILNENSVSIAENSGGPRYHSELFHFTPLVTLRGDDSVPESLLLRPGDFTVDESNHYYVLDTRDCKVAVFNSAGQYVQSFGRRGSGPGDFTLMRLQSFRDGIISIFDSSQQRTTHYNTDGTLNKMFRLSAGGRVFGLELMEDGGYFAIGRKTSPQIESHQEHVSYRSLVVTHLAAVSEDTLAMIETGEIGYTSNIYIGHNDGKPGYLISAVPYSGNQTARYVPGQGILVSEGIEPVLSWYDLAGELIREIRLGIDPQLVTEEMKGVYAESVIGNVASVEPEWIYPEYLGHWNDAVVDDAGYIWLQAVAEAALRDCRVGTVMQIVSPEGEYLGVTELPCRFEGVSRGRLLGYVTDEETGERIPSVFRIDSAVRGLRYPN